MKLNHKIKKLIEPKKRLSFKVKRIITPKPIAFVAKKSIKSINKLNNMGFGVAIFIICIVILFGILVANRITLERTLISNTDVGIIIAEWNQKVASLCYISFMFICQRMWIDIIANRRPRKPQIFKEVEME